MSGNSRSPTDATVPRELVGCAQGWTRAVACAASPWPPTWPAWASRPCASTKHAACSTRPHRRRNPPLQRRRTSTGSATSATSSTPGSTGPQPGRSAAPRRTGRTPTAAARHSLGCAPLDLTVQTMAKGQTPSPWLPRHPAPTEPCPASPRPPPARGRRSWCRDRPRRGTTRRTGRRHRRPGLGDHPGELPHHHQTLCPTLRRPHDRVRAGARSARRPHEPRP